LSMTVLALTALGEIKLIDMTEHFASAYRNCVNGITGSIGYTDISTWSAANQYFRKQGKGNIVVTEEISVADDSQIWKEETKKCSVGHLFLTKKKVEHNNVPLYHKELYGL